MKRRIKALTVALLSAYIWAAAAEASAQQAERADTPDLAGTWVIDAEKSFTKSFRSKVASYTLKITVTDDKVILAWDYTVEGKRSNYSETLRPDGRDHDYPRISNMPTSSHNSSRQNGKAENW